MGLLDRARELRAEREEQRSQSKIQQDKIERRDLAGYVSRLLEVDLDKDELSPARRETGHRALYQFELEGMKFIVGRYWHGNPGHSYYLAVQTQFTVFTPEWPPPSPQSVSNIRWAPKGYKPVPSLAWLADAFEN